MHQLHLLSDIGTAIIFSTALAFLAKALKQPSLLAYLLAGVVIGPEVGLGWVKDPESIHLISEIGLILVLFLVGAEIELDKIKAAGASAIVTGVVQFLAGSALGFGFAYLLRFPSGGGHLDAFYMGIGMAFSSTIIVIRLLYDKFELSTLPGRITSGVAVCQDLWAIVFLAVQPNLNRISGIVVVVSLAKVIGLIVVCLGLSRYVLPHCFRFVAKTPELMMITALAWCFIVSGAANSIGLSYDTGALVAGISMSTVPYNADVVAKVMNIRDFFVTLFFVALGMEMHRPTFSVLLYALAAVLFIVLSRVLTMFPVLYLMKNGLRTSLVPAINLGQMSEFSLHIAAIGLLLHHISSQTANILSYIFALAAIASTYLISYSHQVQAGISGILRKMGLQDLGRESPAPEEEPAEHSWRIVFLGFFREASSVLHEFELQSRADTPHSLLRDILVIDFNPVVHRELNGRGIKCVYGDISSLDTLHREYVEHAKLLLSTIPDAILRGTSNLRLLQQARRLTPEASVVLTSDTIHGALELYESGADFVFVPRLHSAAYIAEVIVQGLESGFQGMKEEQVKLLEVRQEVLP